MSFGGKAKSSVESKTTNEVEKESQQSRGFRTEQLVLEQEAIDKIVQDVLGGADGLASIFAGEQTAGIFNSSVSAQAAGDLAASLVGEIAKITGRTEIRSAEDVERDRKKRTKELTKGASAEAAFEI